MALCCAPVALRSTVSQAAAALASTGTQARCALCGVRCMAAEVDCVRCSDAYRPWAPGSHWLGGRVPQDVGCVAAVR
eukprot:733013-Pelagomonas_calceolata.AAC.2